MRRDYGSDKAGTALLRWLPILVRYGSDKAGTALLRWLPLGWVECLG